MRGVPSRGGRIYAKRNEFEADGELYQGLMSELVRVIASRLTGARRRLAELG
jgi:hypothetical protein